MTTGLLPKGLSGRLLVVTAVFIMMAEVLVFVPSVANYRLTWLARHFSTGEAAALALEQLDPPETSGELADRLLRLTQTDMIVVRRDGAARVLAQSEMPGTVATTVQLTMPGRSQALASIREAFDTLLSDGSRLIRVVGPMETRVGQLELVLRETGLRADMLSYARNVMLISFFISLGAALLVFLALRWLLIRPMQRLTSSMLAFADDPEDPAHVIEPSGRHDEIGTAEEQLAAMQTRLRGTLTQQRHLAELGLAVSKINHDLRNVLASASLFSERLQTVADPVVQRLAPRLVKSIDRAAGYASSVLAYGKAGESLPERRVLRLWQLAEEVAQSLGLDGDETSVEWVNTVPTDLEVTADSEQLFRILANLARNAVQAMEALPDGPVTVRRLSMTARRDASCTRIEIFDTGPGLPDGARDNLFAAFKPSAKSGGTGLGLAIAAELTRAHGGTIRLLDRSVGTAFEIELPF